MHLFRVIRPADGIDRAASFYTELLGREGEAHNECFRKDGQFRIVRELSGSRTGFDPQYRADIGLWGGPHP